jgi:hypothetical protein
VSVPVVPYGPGQSHSSTPAAEPLSPRTVAQKAAGFTIRTALVIAVTKVLPVVVKLLFRVIFRR